MEGGTVIIEKWRIEYNTKRLCTRLQAPARGPEPRGAPTTFTVNLCSGWNTWANFQERSTHLKTFTRVASSTSSLHLPY